jgi:hypothetical protein
VLGLPSKFKLFNLCPDLTVVKESLTTEKKRQRLKKNHSTPLFAALQPAPQNCGERLKKIARKDAKK